MTSDNDNSDEADRETLAHLERLLPRVTPPADTFERILAEIQPEATVIPLRPKSQRRLVVPAVGHARRRRGRHRDRDRREAATAPAHPMRGQRSRARAIQQSPVRPGCTARPPTAAPCR